MDVKIRLITVDDAPFLREMLYHAIFLPPGAEPLPFEIVDEPALRAYIIDFGTHDGDIGVLALVDEQPVGAAWARLLHGYGFVDAQTPELSIALLPNFRGQGIGTLLLEHLFAALKPHFAAVSLSVQAENPAARLYQRQGFEAVKSEGGSLTMVRRLR
jgi:ribosomal protein S18 acetylase RimI-like enzyme